MAVACGMCGLFCEAEDHLEDETMSKREVTNTRTEAMKNPIVAVTTLGICGGDGSAIEASEKRGQEELVASELLPMDLQRCDDAFEKLGFVLGEPVEGDPLFRYATFPKGWTRAATDHSMWSEIRDAEGRVRVMVFYKAAFYDRKAHARIERRYDVDAFNKKPATVTDRKTETVLFTSEAVSHEAYGACSKWLRENRPIDSSGNSVEYALALVAEWEDAPAA